MSNKKRYIIILLSVSVVVLIINMLDNYRPESPWRCAPIFCFSVALAGCLSYFAIYEWTIRRLKHRDKPLLFLITMLPLIILCSIIIMVTAMKITVAISHINDYAEWDYVLNCIYLILYMLLLGELDMGLYYFAKNKANQEEKRKMREEMTIGQFELLKTQVNPHFLFNSLNTLSAIIPEDPETAVAFVKQLSNILRYSLETVEQNVVPLEKELKITESYLFLNKQRFDDKLNIIINVDQEAIKKCKIVAQALLMLVENAIKHNEISLEHPLKININNDNHEYLTISNSLRPKNIADASTGIGLNNIIRRYALVSEKKVLFDDANNAFTVKVPLLV